jgi:hypothetical protein
VIIFACFLSVLAMMRMWLTVLNICSLPPPFFFFFQFFTVRAWNAASGKSFFLMDGFDKSISSLCLLDATYSATNTMLITDGMKQFVCVHDFSIDDEADYDLEMPEYLSE